MLACALLAVNPRTPCLEDPVRVVAPEGVDLVPVIETARLSAVSCSPCTDTGLQPTKLPLGSPVSVGYARTSGSSEAAGRLSLKGTGVVPVAAEGARSRTGAVDEIDARLGFQDAALVASFQGRC